MPCDFCAYYYRCALQVREFVSIEELYSLFQLIIETCRFFEFVKEKYNSKVFLQITFIVS